MTRPWFDSTDCTTLEIRTLEIRKYQSISERQVVRSVTIEDGDVVNSFIRRIESIPADGNKMVSWGPNVESIDLLFYGNHQLTQKIEIYQGHFKTPSTGFNSRGDIESSLYADIDTLLFPSLAKRVLKVKNLELHFGEFSLTYLGEKHSPPAPVTASWTADQFLIKDASNNKQLIEVASGQRPPAPYHFDIGGVGLTLLTYQTDAQERLYPYYCQVVRL